MAGWPDWLILHLVNNSTLSTNRFKAMFQPSKDQFYKIKECFQRSIDVTPGMARDLIHACRERNIDCIVAPYEGNINISLI